MSESESKHTAGALLYRPQKYDDWGWLRSSQANEDGFHPIVAEVRAGRNLTDAELDEHRRVGADPYGANAKRVMLCWNCHDELLAALRGMLHIYDHNEPEDVMERAAEKARAAIAAAEASGTGG